MKSGFVSSVNNCQLQQSHDVCSNGAVACLFGVIYIVSLSLCKIEKSVAARHSSHICLILSAARFCWHLMHLNSASCSNLQIQARSETKFSFFFINLFAWHDANCFA